MQEVTPAEIGYSEILLQNRFGLQRAADPLRLLLVFEQRAAHTSSRTLAGTAFRTSNLEHQGHNP